MGPHHSTMERYPDLAELERFFGVAALPLAHAERQLWFYRPMTFHLQRDNESVICTLSAADGDLALTWSVGAELRLDIQLQGLVSLDLSHSAGLSTLIGRISQGDQQQLFKLRLHPGFCFLLGSG